MTLVKKSLPPFEEIEWPQFLNLHSKNSIFDSLFMLEIGVQFDYIENFALKFEFLVAIDVSVE